MTQIYEHYRMPGRIGSHTQAIATVGIMSHTFPSNFLPFAFLLRSFPSSPHAPHCLKKKSTPTFSHWSRMDKAHSSFMGRAPWPDSPPTMTQWIPFNFNCPKFSRRGSTDKNRVFALIANKSGMRGLPYFLSSTDTPSQAFSGTGRVEK